MKHALVLYIPPDLWAKKPKHGQPCNRCGLCCLTTLCGLASRFFLRPEVPGPCPALLEEGDGTFSCGLVKDPASFNPVGCARHGTVEMGRAAAVLTNSGNGCDMSTDRDPPDRAYLARMESHDRREADRAALGKRMWGVEE